MATQEGTQLVIRCPECSAEIPLNRALTQEIQGRIEQEYAGRLKQQLAAKADEYELKLAAEREKVREEVLRKEAVQQQAVQEQLTALGEEVTQRREAELKLRREKRELETAKETLALDVERRVGEERQRIESKIRETVSEQHRLKDLEKDRQLEDLRRQLADAHRRAEEGSQQRQGEVLELDLEARLHEAFPHDRIEPVAKGGRGGDVLQVVCDSRGQVCGTILWETKNTKAFSDSWLPKLRGDQREKNADVAVLVTAVVPKDMPHFGQRGGVWVSDLSTWLPLAAVLRAGLVETARARQAQQGQADKQAVLYRYLCGVEFRQRVEAIVEAAATLLGEDEKEQAALQAIRARRKQRLFEILRTIANLYGDVDGIVGGSLPKITRLELPPAA